MIEWLASSCFSFLEGATPPAELARLAQQLGYAGFGLADRLSQSGLVQAMQGARDARQAGERDFFFAPGIRLHFDHADPLFVYPLHRAAHARLCRFLSQWALAGMSHNEKGLTPLPWREFTRFLREQPAPLAHDYILISVSGRFFPWVEHDECRALREPQMPGERLGTRPMGLSQRPAPSFSVPPTAPGHCPLWLLELRELCGTGEGSALSLAYPLTLAPGTEDLLSWLEWHSETLDIPLLATSLPLFAEPRDQDLCDLLCAMRHRRPLARLGYLRQANGARHLLSPGGRAFYARLVGERRRGRSWNDPFARGLDLARRHAFSLTELRYTYPRENVPPGETAPGYLRRLALEGAARLHPAGIPADTLRQLEHELALIRRLGYEDYFLTIFDVLAYAREKQILFQGRGSAANSALCYCLGITAIDPVRMGLLFERFLSMERNEPPDIDVDFEHERREEVMQQVYRRYGRERAAMVATYTCFRGRMSTRETAKALGLPAPFIDALITFMGREGRQRLLPQEGALAPALVGLLREHGITPLQWRRLMDLSGRLRGLPRHIGLHTGGFILSNELLSEQCVLEPARLQNRSLVPWDKDDVDALGWMKVDLLSLGMLTAIRKALALINETALAPLTLPAIPAECPRVYAAMQRGDTVGVFQIESRAQMNMLPRLAPKCFYDIVVEVAIVRPGPLQGGMVHPYLRRRQGLEPVTYEHPDLKPILEKTMGVSIFQEQVMKIAVAVAGFTPGEADLLRKGMSGAWRSKSRMHEVRDKLLSGMAAKGVSRDLAERLYRQIEGFGEYGFPESHAASFALLTYASTWLKVHHPAAFLCALLNAQPMGFYAPRSLVGDAERHGVKVLPVDIFYSQWDATLEPAPGGPAVRLGLRLVQGLSRAEADQVECLRRRVPAPGTLAELGLAPRTLEKLVRANACRGLQTNFIDPRREQLWQTLQLRRDTASLPLTRAPVPAAIQAWDEWTALLKDYATVGLTPGRHPAAYARENFFRGAGNWINAERIYALPARAPCRVLGLLTIKQKPPTAGGLTFLTLEDETGFFNLVVHREVYEACRLIIDNSPLIAAEGWIERSRPAIPGDARTAAVSLQVQRLWNPFLASALTKREQRTLYTPRDYH